MTEPVSGTLDLIGQWVARYIGARRLTLFHLVESEIAGRVVVRCGRQLAPIEDTAVLPQSMVPEANVLERCFHCKGRE